MSKRRRFAFSVALILAAAFFPSGEVDAGKFTVKLYQPDCRTEINTAPLATVTVSSAANKITSISSVGTTVTVTTAVAHGFTLNKFVVIANCSGYEGTFPITFVNATQFKYVNTVSGSPSTSGGTATMYHIWPGQDHNSGASFTIDTGTAADKSVTLRFDYAGGATIQDGYFGGHPTEMKLNVVLSPGVILHGFDLQSRSVEARREGEVVSEGASCDCGSPRRAHGRLGIFRSRCR